MKHSSLLICQAAESDHIKELGNARPKQPFFFLKPPSSILPPNSGPVLRPKGVSLHYEVELALIMGREVRDLREDDREGAMNAIECGYCVCDACWGFWRRGQTLISMSSLRDEHRPYRTECAE